VSGDTVPCPRIKQSKEERRKAMTQFPQAPPMHKPLSARSRKNVSEAMRGEAFAFAQYKVFARQARLNGHHEIADLFEKTADEEYLEHFTELSNLPGLAETDEQALNYAIAGESHEADTIYKLFAQEALEDGDLEVATRFTELRHDEAIHRLAFQDALIRLQVSENVEGKK
jgi:rubrerythrin